MIKLRKFAYKFWLPILLCIGFVFIQSQSELALPDYMSDIVTNGIQAGGFDTSIGEVYSQDTFEHLLIFADENQKETIESSYTFTSYDELSQDLKDTFPKLKDAYVIKDLSSQQKENLENALVKPMLMVSAIDSMDPDSKEYQQLFQNVPAGMDIYQVFAMMDEQSMSQITAKMDSQIETMGESTMLVAAGNGVKNEYMALGADVDQMQTEYIFMAGLKMLGIALLGSLAAMGSAFLSSRVGAGFARDLRKAVFAKVTTSFGGQGLEKIQLDAVSDYEALYDRLLSEKKTLVEDALLQNEAMASLCPQSVNTLRMVTVFYGGQAHYVYGLVRMGNGKNAVDNISAGGLYALLNDDGTLSPKAFCDKKSAYYEAHPASGVRFGSFSVPYFAQAKALCLTAAALEQKVGYVGWDVAVTKDGPVLIEGNHLPGYDMCQNHGLNGSRTGILPRFEAIVGTGFFG